MIDDDISPVDDEVLRCVEARELDAVSFRNVFREVCAEVFDELLEDCCDNVVEDFSSKMWDVVSIEVSIDLVSERLLASPVSGSSSLGLLFLSRARYFSCHEIFSSFNFNTSFRAPSLAFAKSSRSDLNFSLSSLRTVILWLRTSAACSSLVLDRNPLSSR